MRRHASNSPATPRRRASRTVGTASFDAASRCWNAMALNTTRQPMRMAACRSRSLSVLAIIPAMRCPMRACRPICRLASSSAYRITSVAAMTRSAPSSCNGKARTCSASSPMEPVWGVWSVDVEPLEPCNHQRRFSVAASAERVLSARRRCSGYKTPITASASGKLVTRSSSWVRRAVSDPIHLHSAITTSSPVNSMRTSGAPRLLRRSARAAIRLSRSSCARWVLTASSRMVSRCG